MATLPLVSLLVAALLGAAPPRAALTTLAERTGYRQTGRYDEVLRLCRAFAAAHPRRVRCVELGRSPEGRPIVALVASADGVLDAQAARTKGRPVVVVQGGIHAGEIDGKDAGFAFLRDALAGRVVPRALAAVTLVFVPVYNVDGHERFGPNHRPNQRGPEKMGWRVTAQNLNLNRDYAKAEAPETALMLRLLNAWDPVLYVDLHVTDGAQFRHDVAVLLDPATAVGAPLQATARRILDRLVGELRARKHRPLDFYPSFVKDDDPSSGFAVSASPPRLSNPYWALRDRLGLLVETHSWHTYPQRVRATRAVLEIIVDAAARDGAAWRREQRKADEAAARIGGREVVLAWDPDPRTKRTIDFLGYAYRRTPSAVSGRLRITYDERRPRTWRIPLVAGVKPSNVVRAPRAGYVVPAAWADLVAGKLRLHGFRVERLAAARRGVAAQVFRATEVQFAPKPFEGRTTATVKGAWAPERVDLPAGSLFVPVGQPGARLLVHLLEPTAPDSLTSWGFFNACFEQKEYMEAYVAEAVAERLLARDPAVAAEFSRRLETDPAFAADPRLRLEFFYRRHPSWDERKDLVPVYRVDAF